MGPGEPITATERRELRAVVRAQMNVLRAEVTQRATELDADIEARLAERYRDEDRRIDEFNAAIRDVVTRANAEIEGLLAGYRDEFDGGTWKGTAYLSCPRIYRRTEDRTQLREAMRAGVKAQAKAALVDLARREADLLRDLAIDALETAAARAFLTRIPTVADLVPARRLAEIEAAFDQRST